MHRTAPYNKEWPTQKGNRAEAETTLPFYLNLYLLPSPPPKKHQGNYQYEIALWELDCEGWDWVGPPTAPQVAKTGP